MKAVLMSIQPKWCELIASGKKTVEVRKTKPKLETPFKVYIYCTNTKPYLVWGDVFRGNWETEFTHLSGYNRADAEKIWDVFNGKVIGEFVCDKVDEYRYGVYDGEFCYHIPTAEGEKTFMEYNEAEEYGNGKPLYFWHITDLVIYDNPRELGEFATFCDGLTPSKCDKCEYSYKENTESGSYEECMCNGLKPITRPPQSWCYVEVEG